MSRLVVAFDTATEAIAVALGRWPAERGAGDPEVLGESDVVAARASLSRVLPAVHDLLGEAGCLPSDVDLVVVGRGPGSYTGVRIGVAAAKGLAQGLGVPLMGVGTLDAVAWGLKEHEGLVGVVGDAMRSEVYPALFRAEHGAVRRLGPDSVTRPSEAASSWADLTEEVLLAGDGLSKHLDDFARALGDRAVIAPRERWLPRGRGVLDAGWDLGIDAATEPGSVLPVYTRLSDAEHVEPGRGPDVPPAGVAGPIVGDA